MLVAILLVSCFVAGVTDFVGIRWHAAREAGAVVPGTALAIVHEALTWAPVVLAVETGNAYALALAAMLGVGVANVYGLRRRPA